MREIWSAIALRHLGTVYAYLEPQSETFARRKLRTYAPTLTKSVPHSGEHTVRYIDGVGANRVFALPHNVFYKSNWNHCVSPKLNRLGLAADALGDFPHRGCKVPEFNDQRREIKKILAVVHGSRGNLEMAMR
jgi:hypothetical protein